MFLTDALGSLVATTDAAGGVQSELTYEPFGNTEMSSPAPAYRFTGREHDEPLYLYYYRARYYHTDLQRFISEDPLRVLVGSSNLFEYVGNSPLNWADPFGLFTIAVSGGYEVVPGAGGTSYHSGGYWSVGESAGLFNTSGSNNTGVEASAGISLGFYRGGVNQFMGPFSNWSVQTPWVSVSVFYDACGKFMGAGVGLGLGIGAANTQTNTVPAAQADKPSDVWQAPWNYNPPRASTCSKSG